MTPNQRAAAADGETLGARVRALRRSAGLSQAELAAGRCSKEYVSQIERGKSRPSPETVAWLAERLGTDPGFLEHGVSSEDVERLDSMLRDAEHLVEDHRYDDALRAFEVGARGAGLGRLSPVAQG